MSFVHRTLCSGVIWLISLGAVPSQVQGQSCDPCAEKWKRRVSLYDADVRVPRPTNPSEVGNWLQLFFASGGMRSALMNNDPTVNCIIPIDGAMYPTGERVTDTLMVGIEHMNLPPGGAVKAGDYLVWGRVEQSGSGYRLDVILEAAITRERAASGTTFFSSATDAMDRGAQAYAQAIAPIRSTIYQWERQKRDADPTVAIGVTKEGCIIAPSKREVSAGEEIDVEIRLVDCDDVPLGGRTIILTQSQFQGVRLNGSENGTFTSATATTDNQGIARVRFVAGMQQGPAVLRAYFVYRNPPGRDMVIGASEVITVGRTELWEIHAGYQFERELVQDTAWTAYGGSFTYHRESSLSGSATMRALLRAKYDSGNLYIEELVSMSIAGIWQYRSFSFNRGLQGGLLVGAGVSIASDDGIAVPEEEQGSISLLGFFDEGGDEMTINVAPVFMISRYYHERTYSPSQGGWRTSEGERVEPSDFPSEYHHGRNGTIVRSANRYTASFSTVDTVFTPYVGDGSARTITKTFLNAVIHPYSPLTGVDAHVERTFPNDFCLFQNYPNPFNPETRIRYALPVGAHVSLKLYNMLGQEAAVLVDAQQEAGWHEVRLSGAALPSGVYFYRLQAGGYSAVRKLVLIR